MMGDGMKKGLLRTTAIVAAIAGVSSAAQAGMLETLQQTMAAGGAPGDAFSYETVVSNTDTGFEITGVTMQPGPGAPPVTMDVLRIDALDMVATQAGAPPTFIDMNAEGVHVPYDVLDPDSQAIFPDGLTFDFGIDYRLDQAAETLDLNEFSFSVAGYGDVSVSAELSGLSIEALAGAMFAGPEALGDVTISSASITLDDEGGLAALFETAAAEEGMDLDSFVNSAMMPQLEMMGMMFAADPVGADVFESIVAFLGDYASPQGPLTITAQPSAPVSLSSLMQLADPSSLPSILGLGASYAGGAAEEAPPAEATGERQSSLFGQDAQGQRTEAAPTNAPSTEAVPAEAAPVPAAPAGDGAFATLLAMANAAGMPAGALTYDAVVSDTPEGFVLSNVHFEPEPGDFIEIGTLSVGRIDMDSIAAGMPPLSLQLAALDVMIPTEDDPDMRALFGNEPVTANIYVDYVLDPGTGEFDVNGVSLEMVDLGTLTFTLGLGGVTPEMIVDMVAGGGEQLNAALLQNAALSYSDTGLMRRMLAMGAAWEGTTEQAMVDEALAGLDDARPMFASDPIASAALDALRGFIADYQAPHGPISVVLNPPTPVALGAIETVADPSQIPQMLGMAISY